jgi:hypothetical protein
VWAKPSRRARGGLGRRRIGLGRVRRGDDSAAGMTGGPRLSLVAVREEAGKRAGGGDGPKGRAGPRLRGCVPLRLNAGLKEKKKNRLLLGTRVLG